MTMIYVIAATAEITFGKLCGTLSGEIGQAVAQSIPTLLLYWAVVTLVFVCIEGAARGRVTISGSERDVNANDLDPMKLPQPAMDRSRSLGSRVADLSAQAVPVIYVALIPYYPALIPGPRSWYLHRLDVGLSPGWHPFYLGALLLLSGQLEIKVFELLWFTGRSVVGLDLLVKAWGSRSLV